MIIIITVSMIFWSKLSFDIVRIYCFGKHDLNEENAMHLIRLLNLWDKFIHWFCLNCFIVAGKELNEMCETHQQCTGTDNANTCRLVGNSSICNCNDKFDLMDGKCLKSKMHIK